jgi:hypothetical protein
VGDRLKSALHLYSPEEERGKAPPRKAWEEGTSWTWLIQGHFQDKYFHCWSWGANNIAVPNSGHK